MSKPPIIITTGRAPDYVRLDMFQRIKAIHWGDKKTSSSTPFNISLTLDVGFPLPAGLSRVGDYPEIFYFVLAAFSGGELSEDEVPTKFDFCQFNIEHWRTAGGLDGPGVSQQRFTLSLTDVGADSHGAESIVLLCYCSLNADISPILNTAHAHFTATEDGGKGRVINSPVSPNIGAIMGFGGDGSQYVSGDIGEVGNSDIGTTSLDIISLSLNFDASPPTGSVATIFNFPTHHSDIVFPSWL